MNIKKPLLIAGAAASIGIAGIAGLGVASAATSTDPEDGQANLISKIAQKFNVKEADVAAVFDEDRAAHEADMQKNMEDKLTQAVADGSITNEQKDKILAKLTELKAERQLNLDTIKDKTPEERSALMKEQRAELRTWAEDNDVPPRYLMFSMEGHGHGFRKDKPDMSAEAMN